MPVKSGPKTLEGSDEAKKLACVVIEVLSGIQSPTHASQLLGTSLARYYILETRALQGLITALEPRGRGPQKKVEVELNIALKENKKLQSDLLRSQSLVRTMHRSIGLNAFNTNKTKTGKKIYTKRKNQVRGKRITSELKTQTSNGKIDKEKITVTLKSFLKQGEK